MMCQVVLEPGQRIFGVISFQLACSPWVSAHLPKLKKCLYVGCNQNAWKILLPSVRGKLNSSKRHQEILKGQYPCHQYHSTFTLQSLATPNLSVRVDYENIHNIWNQINELRVPYSCVAPQEASHLTQLARPSIPGSRQIWVCKEEETGAVNGAEAPWGGQGKDLSIETWWVTVETRNLEILSSDLFCHRELFCHFRVKIFLKFFYGKFSLFFQDEDGLTLTLLIKSTN